MTKTLNGSRQGSLLSTIDRTVTAGGARLLEQQLGSPSLDVDDINNRLDGVDDMCGRPEIRRDIRLALRKVPDLERALSRIALERGGPRDLANIRSGLKQALQLFDHLQEQNWSQHIRQAINTLCGHETLSDLLEQALVAEPPLLTRDGGFVSAGYDALLDEARLLRDEGRGVIAKMQGDYIALSRVQSLKIKHINVLGYFIETPSTHAEKMLAAPLNETFIHRQTTANQVRFTTVELSEIETKILNAGDKALEIEKRIFGELCKEILRCSESVSSAAAGMSILDVSSALADLAVSENWIRPLVDDSRTFTIQGGRHPVVEAAVKISGNTFIPNDCSIDDGGIWLLTGPNMAGNHIFTPERFDCDACADGKLCSGKTRTYRIGDTAFQPRWASDDLARGRSTFMVEMIETAAILNQSESGPSVILDEIGRGTATYDGLSIAWATLEHLHDVNQTRALFATHYHELTNLSTKLDRWKMPRLQSRSGKATSYFFTR